MLRVPAISRTIHAELREKITSGALAQGDRLPTTTEIAKAFGCSVNMASKAITMLIHEGLVEQKRGLGSRVISNVAPKQGGSVDLDAFAFIYPSERHAGIWRTVEGFQEAAAKQQRRVVMLSVGGDYSKETEYLSRLAEFDVRGAILYPVFPSPQDQVHICQLLVESKFPIVLVDLSFPGLGCPSVVVDNFHAGYTMTRYLLDKGLSRIGFFANHSWASSISQRYQGYLWALKEKGIAPVDRFTLLEPSMVPNFSCPHEQATAMANSYLKLNRADVQGVVCGNDHMAQGMIRAALENGIRVPEDLKVTGIDGLTQEFEIPLTTYSVPLERIGAQAFAILDALTKKQKLKDPETRVSGSITIRKSA